MKVKIEKILDYAAVIIAIFIGIYVVINLPVEPILKGKQEPVTIAMTEKGLPEDYIGKPADDDIPRIEDAETWKELWQTRYVTIEPIGIVSTGYGSRHPWVDAYTRAGRRGGTRRRPDVRLTVFDVLDEYGEYYLLQLPDESYILAQISTSDARKIKAGKEITLPVGRKAPVSMQILPYIEDLCEKYGVDTSGVFYCIDDAWNEGHSFVMLLVRIGIIAITVIVMSVILITLIEKFLKKKESEQVQ